MFFNEFLQYQMSDDFNLEPVNSELVQDLIAHLVNGRRYALTMDTPFILNELHCMQQFLCSAQYSLCAYDAYQGEVPAVIVNESKGFFYVYREKSLLHIIGLYLNEYAEFTYDVNTSRFSVNHHEFCVLDQSFHSELVQEFLNISNKCVSLMAPAGCVLDMGVF